MTNDRVAVITDSVEVLEELIQILEFVGYEVNVYSVANEVLSTDNVQSLIIYNKSLKITQEMVRFIKTTGNVKDIPIIAVINEKYYVTLLELYQIGISDYIELPIIDVEAISKIALHIELKKNREKIESLYKELKDSLELSTQLQKLMLPNSIALEKDVWITANYMPSQIVGGDIYDYFSIGDDVYIYVADISGHGIQSALLCSAVKSVIRSAAQRSSSVVDIVNELSESVKTVLGHNYITGLFMKITGNTVEYIDCGHPAIIEYDGKEFKVMDMKTVFPIGLFDYTYIEEDIDFFELQAEKIYMAYSDGLYSIFEKLRPNENSMNILLDFLNKDISGTIPEVLPQSIAATMRRKYSELPDDYSLVSFGKATNSIYFSKSDTLDIMNLEIDREIKVLLDELLKNVYSDEYTLLVNDYDRYFTILAKGIETGKILRKLPMSIALSYHNIDCLKVFKQLKAN
ncbi:PP2C family protein-serine/threonine phosphatase [Fervidobacterium sp.]